MTDSQTKSENIKQEGNKKPDSLSGMSLRSGDDDIKSISTVEKQEDLMFDNPIESIGDSVHRRRAKSIRRALFGSKKRNNDKGTKAARVS